MHTDGALRLHVARCLLQKQRDATGMEVLSKLDKLYVVHVFKDGKKEKDKDKWCAGGPLLPGMRVALAKFPHQVVEIDVRHSPLLSSSE